MDANPLSVAAVPGPQGFDAWREGFVLKVARLDIAAPDRTTFTASTRVRPLPGAVLAQNWVDPCSLTRTPALVRDGDDAVTLIMCLNGGAEIRFGDDATALLPGQAILLPHHRPSDSIWRPSHTYALRLERDVARRVAPSVEAALWRTTAPGDPSFALLTAYCAQLMAIAGVLPGATATLAGAHIEELTAHLLGRRDAREHAGGSGLRAARFAAIRDDIARNLGQRDLSAATLAARHRLTQRQVQRLFESEGTTFSEYVLDQRLARVRRLLGDPRRTHEKISGLAAEVGFVDLSHFNRAFRRRYGDTPSDVRMAAPGSEM
jgi:AraC-like DNA-binding protein